MALVKVEPCVKNPHPRVELEIWWFFSTVLRLNPHICIIYILYINIFVFVYLFIYLFIYLVIYIYIAIQRKLDEFKSFQIPVPQCQGFSAEELFRQPSVLLASSCFLAHSFTLTSTMQRCNKGEGKTTGEFLYLANKLMDFLTNKHGDFSANHQDGPWLVS
jgi:hypothetical protein